ncbi:MAG: hypothetical protein V2A65_08535 [Candidatus Omnitrophota bacterium]
MTDKKPVVWNKPIDPVQNPDFAKRNPKPVTREDLGADYLTAGLRDIPVKGSIRKISNQVIVEEGSIDLTKFRRAITRWNDQSLKPGESSEDKLRHNFGKCLWLNYSFLKASDWKEALKEIKRQGLFLFDTWGFLPGGWAPTREMHNHIQRVLGPKFLGWDIGEQDGRWFSETNQIYPALVNREDGWKNFQEWHNEIPAGEHHYSTPLCSLTYPHYYLEMGGRMIGAEFLQALPSTNMWASFIRGAARQYQSLWFAGMSVWNKFGWKRFTANYHGSSHASHESGPDHGPTLSLIEQTWYLLYSYGVNIQALEASQFIQPPGAKEEYLSPLGELQLKVTGFSTRFSKRRGVQYCPVALLLDFHSGWAPPRNNYSDSLFNTWGTVPYQPGDHQIDLFFREVFPGYLDCPFFRQDKGSLTATPYGDIFDVLLSNIREQIFSRYRLVCVLGETKIENELLDKLLRYVQNGGKVVWNYPQLSEEAKRLVHLKETGKTRTGQKSVDSRSKEIFKEGPYSYPEVKVKSGEGWLESDTGRPLITSCQVGKGEIITLIPPFGMGNRKELENDLPLSYPNNVYGDWDADVDFQYLYWEKPLGTPYQFLEGVKKILFEYIDTFNLIEVTSSDVPGWNDDNIVKEYGLDPETSLRKLDIQFTTCLREEPDKLVVTLINTNLVSAYGRLRVKNGRIVKALDVLENDSPVPIRKDGGINFHLKPKDFCGKTVLILELHLDKPIVRFME